MKEDGRYLMKQGLRLLVVSNKALIVHLIAHLALLFEQMYSKFINACKSKPKLFGFFVDRWCVWATRFNHWQTRFEEIATEADELTNDINEIKDFYNL